MGQLSKATQQNASASEQLAATSEELTGQAEQLQQSIAFFNIGVEAPQLRASQPLTSDRRAAAQGLRVGISKRPSKAVGSTNFRPY
jgi:methyl-accepting chemotaxis protein